MVKFLRALAVCLCASALCAGAGNDFAERLFKAGQRAERSGDTLHAYLLYARAAALDPANVTYAMRRSALQGAAALAGDAKLGPDPALVADDDDDTLDPPQTEPLTARDRLEAREALPVPKLVASADKKSFDLKGDARTIFEKVAEAYGLLVVFEADYQTPPQFTFRMTDVGYEDAFRALESVTNSFMVPVNPRLALVARDTTQKRAEMGQTMSVAIPIPERMTVQDAQEIITAVQQTLDIRRISVDPTRHVVFLRDQVMKVNAARQIFANLSQIRPQIEVEVEFVSVVKNSSLDYGLNLPNQLSLVNFGKFMNNTPSIASGFSTFLTFGGGMTLFGLGVTDASAFATLSRATADTDLKAQIVALDGQAATLHVGDKYPLITNGYYGNTTGSGQVYAPPPTVTFTDLGLVLKVTPTIHDGGEVSLDLEAEFNVLGAGSSFSGIPVISNRKFTGKVRLRDGEWAVIAGLVQTSDNQTATGFAGLMNLPLIGRILRQNTRDKTSNETLLVLKPHLVTLPPWEFVQHPIWIGTETRPITLF